jgi:hypothetical protein
VSPPPLYFINPVNKILDLDLVLQCATRSVPHCAATPDPAGVDVLLRDIRLDAPELILAAGECQTVIANLLLRIRISPPVLLLGSLKVSMFEDASVVESESCGSRELVRGRFV